MIDSKGTTRESFRWRTMKNEILTIDEMKSSHIFNSLKMLYNHLAEIYNKPTYWFKKRYFRYIEGVKDNLECVFERDFSDKEAHSYIADQILFFIVELENRNDLPYKYKRVYSQILTSIGINCKEIKELTDE
jgi:hypothetical protein